jgi:thiamine transporter ThiT
MTTHQKIRVMAGNAILAALTAILTYVSNFLSIGVASFNLSLIPIVLAAILYGPWSGLFMGLVNGGIVLIGASYFLAMNVPATIILCLLKTGLAGLIAGFAYKLISKKNWKVGVIVATIITPCINTGIFCIGSLLFYGEHLAEFLNIYILFNFLIELGINIVLVPSILYVVKVVQKKIDENSVDANLEEESESSEEN